MNPSEFLALPEALPLLLLVPAVWILFQFLDRRRRRRLTSLLGSRRRRLTPDLAEGERRLKRGIGQAAFGFAVVAGLQPMWGEGTRLVAERGVDLVVCLDVSRSMLAKDIAPSRLRYAQQEIRALADRARGDRLALVAFAGEAPLVSPLTRDMTSFSELVDLVDPLSVSVGGTDLGAPLATALEVLRGQTGDHEAVVLVTDGEDLSRNGLEVARRCAERNIRVHCVGIGSPRGSKIAISDGLGGEGRSGGLGGESFLRDSSGLEVVSAMDPASLRKIAEATGGEFLDAKGRSNALLRLYNRRIRPMARKSFDTEGRLERRNRYQWPLLVAFVLWTLELCMTERRRR